MADETVDTWKVSCYFFINIKIYLFCFASSVTHGFTKQALPDFHLLGQLKLILKFKKKQKTGGIATLLMYISQSSLNLSLQYKIGTFFVGMNSRSIVTQEDGFRG